MSFIHSIKCSPFQYDNNVFHYFSLAGADMVTGLFLILPSSISVIANGQGFFLGNIACQITGVLSNTAMMATLFSVVWITVNRWFALMTPLLYRSCSTTAAQGTIKRTSQGQFKRLANVSTSSFTPNTSGPASMNRPNQKMLFADWLITSHVIGCYLFRSVLDFEKMSQQELLHYVFIMRGFPALNGLVAKDHFWLISMVSSVVAMVTKAVAMVTKTVAMVTKAVA
eukprot:sb/3469620/